MFATWASFNTIAARLWPSYSLATGPKRLTNNSNSVPEISESGVEVTTQVSTEVCKLLSVLSIPGV